MRVLLDDPVALAEAYAQLGADPHAGRRHALAFALALALIALLLGLVRWHATDDREAAPVAVVLERIATPPPTPRPTSPPTPVPTPPPTPPPRLARVTPAPVPRRAAPRRVAVAGGARPAPAARAAVPVVAPLASPAPVASAPAPAPATGLSGSGASGGAGSGSGTGAGTGSGLGGAGGTGTGPVDEDVPCGFVELQPEDVPRVTSGTMYERIRATVHFRDGHTASAVFPYDWAYPNGERTDPWSDTNTRLHPDAPVRAQFPPAGADPRRLPPLIRYILDHTRPNGDTILEECPASRP